MTCVEATQGAVAGHPSDGEDMKTSKSALEGLVSLVIRKGHLDFRLPPYNPRGERMAANTWNPSSFVFLFSTYFPYVFFRTSKRASRRDLVERDG
jgi:hypothetical protein